nr:hypothetical protein [Tanacetum cinerariifolium]
KSIDEIVQLKREYDSWVNERQMQTTEEKVDTSKALDASSVDTENSRTESKEHDTSSRSGNDAHDDDADIRPIYDEEPMAEVQTTAEINVFAIGQQHTEQPEFNNEGKKCVFSANHDSCVKKFLKEVNSRAKVPSNKTTKRNKPVEQISVPNKQERQIPTEYRFSIQKTSVVQKKTMTPRSCLRWKPMGKIFKTVGLRWVPTGKIFASSTTKGFKEFSSEVQAMTSDHNSSELELYDHNNEQPRKQRYETSVANNTLGLAPKRQKASDYENSDLVPQREDISSSADAHVPSQQELDLLFGHLYNEFFNAGSNLQDKQPTTNIQPTSAPSTPTYVHAKENNNDQAEEEHLPDDEFTNPFCAPALEVAESSPHNVEQVRRNPSRPVQTRRELATYSETCMFALTISTAEPKNIKEAMADSAWIKAMQEELHQFDRLQVWELVDKPFGKSVIRLNCTLVFSNLSDGRENNISQWSTEGGGLQIYHFPRGIFINQAKYTLEILHKHGMENSQSIVTPMATKPKLDADLTGNPVDQTNYHSKIGSLMYLTSSRPDIVQAGSSFGLTAVSDAGHAGCIDSHKSTSGGIKFLGDKLVSWMSKKQNCTAMSSAEAGHVAVSASYAQVMWMRTQLQDNGFNYNKIPLYCDSQSAIAISCNPIQHSRTKHIHTWYHFIKE